MTDKTEWVKRAAASLEKRGFAVRVFENADEAAAYVYAQAAAAPRVGMGGCMSLKDLGVDRRLAPLGKPQTRGGDCDLFILSANALLLDGRIVNIDGNGNRVAASVSGPKKVLYVIGHNKLVDGGLDDAIARIRRETCPPNARRLGRKTPCGVAGTCADCDSPDRMCKVTVVFDRKPTGIDAEVVLLDAPLGY